MSPQPSSSANKIPELDTRNMNSTVSSNVGHRGPEDELRTTIHKHAREAARQLLVAAQCADDARYPGLRFSLTEFSSVLFVVNESISPAIAVRAQQLVNRSYNGIIESEVVPLLAEAGAGSSATQAMGDSGDAGETGDAGDGGAQQPQPARIPLALLVRFAEIKCLIDAFITARNAVGDRS